jgi:hypothetical protein
LTLRRAKIRFQFGSGADDTLGIADARWTLSLNGHQVAAGITGADGEVSFLMSPIENLVLNIFDTDYNVSLHSGLQPIAQLTGQQKRLDALGYLTGYQLSAIGSDVPDDNQDGARTRQAALNFQTDTSLAMDSQIGNRTKQGITNTLGA